MSDPRAYYNPTTGRIHYLTNDGGPPNEGRPPADGDRGPNQTSSQEPLQGSQMPPSRPTPARHVHFDFGAETRRGPPPPYDPNRWNTTQGQTPQHGAGLHVQQMPVWVQHAAGHRQTQSGGAHGTHQAGGGSGQGQTIWVPVTVPDPPIRSDGRAALMINDEDYGERN
ncbi:uncharacterized protein AB675_3501 [Cyphellophora attinorum]|uniref:Uncharacterized protein n=1 Tax=Cyphellophora attinorum TaxID=1664694 RepID=A0A0N1HTH1_9EURO|nr:uncharacterized protein AB675_3501 [Phialophora attinorum]KPI39816.1 hypothetical protein AB675_3501 [Phialophora attinorum]